jgi:hypothetical protein
MGVARALAAQRGRMRELNVCGLNGVPRAPDEDDYEVDAWRAECEQVIHALRALLAPHGVLHGDTVCQAADDYEGLCSIMCSSTEYVCAHCKTVVCEAHMDGRFRECMECGRFFCDGTCIQSAACDACVTDFCCASQDYYEEDGR